MRVRGCCQFVFMSEKFFRGDEIMRGIAVVGIIIGIGLLVLLKIFQSSIPRISDPLTNNTLLIGFVLFAIIYGASQLRKNNK